MTDSPPQSGSESEPLVSVVVPTYHEAANVRELVGRIDDAMTTADLAYEVVVVDDDSGDGIEEAVAELAATLPVRILVRRGERGLAGAVVHGFTHARGRILVCMDADLSHPPEALPTLVGPIERGEADFVIGSRYVKGGTIDEEWTRWRRLNSKWATLLALPLTRVQDPLSGFFALTREGFERAGSLDAIGYKIGLELLVKSRPARVLEVPIRFQDRQAGESKLEVKVQVQYIQHLSRLYRHRLFSRGKPAARPGS